MRTGKHSFWLNCSCTVVSAGKLDRETTHWPWYVGEVVQPIWEHALDVVSGHKRGETHISCFQAVLKRCAPADERIVVPPTVLCAQGGDEAIQQAMRSLGELAKILRTDSYERRELFLNSSKSVRSPQATDEARQEALRQFERERRRDEDNDARLCGIESLLAQAGSALLGAARSEKTPTERWICKRETDEILFAPWPSDNLGEIPLTGAVDPCDTTAFDRVSCRLRACPVCKADSCSVLRTLVATADACAVLHRDQRRIFERQLEILREHVSKQQPRRSKQVPLASSHPGMSSPSPVPARSCSTSPLSEACTPSPASSWHSSANWPRETPETSTELPPRGETTTPKPKGKAHDRSSV